MSKNLSFLNNSPTNSAKTSCSTPLSPSCSTKSFYPRKHMGKEMDKQKDESRDSSLSYIYKENSKLREQNRTLRRELTLVRGESYINKVFDNFKIEQVDTLRDTVKKEAGELKESKIRIQTLSYQCRKYEDIIEKLEKKIKDLTEDNSELQKVIAEQDCESSQDDLRKTPNFRVEQPQDLQEKLNQIMDHYIQLEQQMAKSEVEWSTWKTKWNNQKNYYLSRIYHLECLLGFVKKYGSVKVKNFYRSLTMKQSPN